MPGGFRTIAGRVANALDLCGPNYTTDAACAASMATSSAVQGLRQGAMIWRLPVADLDGCAVLR